MLNHCLCMCQHVCALRFPFRSFPVQMRNSPVNFCLK
jgi:hypothetical protein